MTQRKLKYGQVGGGQGAFIGAVHRHAMALDGYYDLTAGALSSTPERSRASGAALGLADSRNYPSWEAMLEGELRTAAAQGIGRARWAMRRFFGRLLRRFFGR